MWVVVFHVYIQSGYEAHFNARCKWGHIVWGALLEPGLDHLWFGRLEEHHVADKPNGSKRFYVRSHQFDMFTLEPTLAQTQF